MRGISFHFAKHRLLTPALSSVEEERKTEPERAAKMKIDCR